MTTTTTEPQQATPVCGCGQDLDHAGRAYCPRCGCQR